MINRMPAVACLGACLVSGFVTRLSHATPFTSLITCSPATSLQCWSAVGTASASSPTDGSSSTIPSDALATVIQSDLGIENFTSQSGINATDGSALFQTLTLTPGTTISFNWTATFEPSAVGFAFAWVDGHLFTLAEQTAPLGATGPTGALVSALDPEGVFSYTVTMSGSQTIGFGVANGVIGPTGITGPTGPIDPTVTVSQFNVSSTPEPGSFVLTGAVFLGLALLWTGRRLNAGRRP